MMLVRFLLVLGTCLGLAACGTPEQTCDEPSPYQLSVSGKRVKVPSDLDDLDPQKEVPLPDVSPTKPRPKNSPCLDRPPSISSSGK